MTDHLKIRALVPDAVPPLQPGDQVRTPTGRTATVEAIDVKRGEVSVRFPPEAAAFKTAHLRRTDSTEGGGIVILTVDGPEAA